MVAQATRPHRGSDAAPRAGAKAQESFAEIAKTPYTFTVEIGIRPDHRRQGGGGPEHRREGDEVG